VHGSEVTAQFAVQQCPVPLMPQMLLPHCTSAVQEAPAAFAAWQVLGAEAVSHQSPDRQWLVSVALQLPGPKHPVPVAQVYCPQLALPGFWHAPDPSQVYCGVKV
jgi:hypothetical protein